MRSWFVMFFRDILYRSDTTNYICVTMCRPIRILAHLLIIFLIINFINRTVEKEKYKYIIKFMVNSGQLKTHYYVRRWNPVMNFRTGSGYPVLVINH